MGTVGREFHPLRSRNRSVDHCYPDMKNTIHRSPRTAWLLLTAPALLSTPALAQVATEAAPPPVVPTVTQAAPAPAAPVAAPAPAPAPVAQAPAPAAPAATPTAPGESKTVISPEAQAALDEPTPRVAPRAVARQARSVERSATRTAPAEAAAPTPAPVAPAPATATPPVAAAPAASSPAPAAEAPAPETATAETTATTTETTQQGGSLWPLLAGVGLIVLAGIAFLLFRRSRDPIVEEYAPEQDYVYREPDEVPVAAVAAVSPVSAAVLAAEQDVTPAPTTPEHVEVSDAPAEEVAALTGDAPVSDRPWLEFAMRPVRAGTNVDEALVEIELTVANAGNIAAEDVRVSTFMLTEAHADEMERYLIDPPADAAVNPVTIQPGEGTKIDATLAALKADLGVGESFSPVIVADARYRLPDGTEGRTSASFVIGRSDAAGNLEPFDLADRQMHDDVEVRLHGTPAHA